MSKLQDKLGMANSTPKKEDARIIITYGDKTLFNMSMDLPPYTEEVFASDISMFYFFKEFRNSLEKKIADEHKKLAFKRAEEERGSEV